MTCAFSIDVRQLHSTDPLVLLPDSSWSSNRCVNIFNIFMPKEKTNFTLTDLARCFNQNDCGYLIFGCFKNKQRVITLTLCPENCVVQLVRLLFYFSAFIESILKTRFRWIIYSYKSPKNVHQSPKKISELSSSGSSDF